MENRIRLFYFISVILIAFIFVLDSNVITDLSSKKELPWWFNGFLQVILFLGSALLIIWQLNREEAPL